MLNSSNKEQATSKEMGVLLSMFRMGIISQEELYERTEEYRKMLLDRNKKYTIYGDEYKKK